MKQHSLPNKHNLPKIRKHLLIVYLEEVIIVIILDISKMWKYPKCPSVSGLAKKTYNMQHDDRTADI